MNRESGLGSFRFFVNGLRFGFRGMGWGNSKSECRFQLGRYGGAASVVALGTSAPVCFCNDGCSCSLPFFIAFGVGAAMVIGPLIHLWQRLRTGRL